MRHLPSEVPGVRVGGQKEGYVIINVRRENPFTRTVGHLNGRRKYIPSFANFNEKFAESAIVRSAQR
jgi:hypothetical protein